MATHKRLACTVCMSFQHVGCQHNCRVNPKLHMGHLCDRGCHAWISKVLQLQLLCQDTLSLSAAPYPSALPPKRFFHLFDGQQPRLLESQKASQNLGTTHIQQACSNRIVQHQQRLKPMQYRMWQMQGCICDQSPDLQGYIVNLAR
jgi:hypothetical protein